MSRETKDSLKEPVAELGGLVAMFAGGGALHSGMKKSMNRAVELKTQIQNEVLDAAASGKIIAEGITNPMIELPVKSDGTVNKVRVSTPTTRYAEYREKMGYERYVPDAELPVIQMGDGRVIDRSGLPTIQMDAPKGETRTFPILKPERPDPTTGKMDLPEGSTRRLPIEKADEITIEPIKPDPVRIQKLNDAMVEREILRDALANDPASTLSKFRGKGDDTIAEMQIRSKNSTKIDDAIVEAGYKDVNEAQAAIERYQEAKVREQELSDSIRDLKQELKEGKEPLAEEITYPEPTPSINPDTTGQSVMGETSGVPRAETIPEGKAGPVPESSSILKPIEKGGGERRVSKMASRIADILNTGKDELPGFDSASNKIQGERFDAYVAENGFEAAKKIALDYGKNPPPPDMSPSTFYVGVKEIARNNADTATLLELRDSPYAGSGTAFGQAIQLLSTKADKFDPIKMMDDAIAEQVKSSGKTKKVLDREVAELTKEIKRKAEKGDAPVEEIIRDIKDNLC